MIRTCIGAGLVLVPSMAWAHVELTQPPQRYPAANQYELDIKEGPCGIAANPPGQVGRTTYAAGETITVKWDEFVPHPGHFRIAFDPDGDDDLGDPAGYDDLDTPGVQVLQDGIPHEDGKTAYEYQVTLPDTPCDNCTLQLIQIMTDKPPWGPAGGSDIYYQCADLILEATAGTDTAGDTSASGTSSDTGDSSTTSTSTTDGTSGGGTSSTTTDASTTAPGTTTDASETGSVETDGSDSGDSSSSGCSTTPPPTSALLLLLLARRRRR